MNQALEPTLHPMEIAALRPTQITVGFREVERKRSEWRTHAQRDGGEFLGRHMIPVVIGPRSRPHLIDHHHLALALHDEGVKHVLVSVVADLSRLTREAFRTFLDNRNWLHLYDAKGRRRTYSDLPKHVGGLADDPYRSLAGALRRAGGYAKVDTPFAEFLWADFLRRRIKTSLVEDRFETALVKALDVARSRDANFLPGWAGPSD